MGHRFRPRRAVSALSFVWALLACEPPPTPPSDAGADAPPVDGGRDAGRDSALPDAGPEAPPLDWQPCPGLPAASPIRCATLEVPVDYEDPSLGTFSLPVRIRPAPLAAERLGAIAWNPGGPGVATYPSLPPVAFSTAEGSLTRLVGDRFDLVSMDWRGVGASMPAVECDVMFAALEERLTRTDVVDEAEMMRVIEAFDAWADDCVAAVGEERLARVGTRNAARDLDRLRASLGDRTINFWGFSYGTALGATYAEMFPERVRAFVLDSASLSSTVVVEEGELVTFEARLDEFFTWCAATSTCAFARGRSADGLDAAWRAIVAELDAYPAVVDGATVSGNSVRSRSLAMRLGGRPSFPTMGQALADAEDHLYARLLSMPTMPATTPDEFTTFVAIRVADDGGPLLDAAGAYAWLRSSYVPYLGRLGPAFVGMNLAVLLWPVVPADGPPFVVPTTAPPMLVVGSTGDIATPYADTLAMRDGLANGSYLLTYEGTVHASSSQVPCLRDAVMEFFLEPDTAPTTTRCVGSEP